MKISEIIMNKYKLRMPPTVYYDLLADVVEAEDEQDIGYQLMVTSSVPYAEVLRIAEKLVRQHIIATSAVPRWKVRDKE